MFFVQHNTFRGQTPKRHRRKQMKARQETIVANIPSMQAMFEHIMTFAAAGKSVKPTITLEIGRAVVHPEDQFIRKVGRELATKNMKPVEMTVAQVAIARDPKHKNKGTFTQVMLLNEKENLLMEVLMSISDGTFHVMVGELNPSEETEHGEGGCCGKCQH